MSSQIDISRSMVIPTVMVGSGPVPVPELVPNLTLRVIVEDFELGIDARILEVDRRLEKTEGDISLRVEIADNIDANIVLSGKEQVLGFEIRELSVQLWPKEQPAEVAFVASTLNAALKLCRKVSVQMSEIGLDLTMTAFDSPLLEISNLLRERQTAYRLMVIERATGVDFGPLPLTISGEEVATISFVYHAIVDRTFVDGLRDVEVITTSNEEGSKFLDQLKNSPLSFPNENISISKRLLGKQVTLGPQIVTITDTYLENLDQITEEIGRCDGHEVKIVIRSRTNRAHYSFLEAPSLPPTPWEPAVQKLIDLEEGLDSRLIERYHTLAASTLAGLNEEERIRMTRRVELDEDSFLIDKVEERNG